MGKIVVSQNVSVDGVVEDPSGGEGFRHGGWFGQFMRQDWEAWFELELAEAQGAEALLLGRRSDEYFAKQSASQSGDWVDRLNSMPKYVVSSTLRNPEWNNSIVLAADVIQEVSKLKEQLAGMIVVAGSIRLVRTLVESDLVDELRLMIFPVVLGGGERLFGETSDQRFVRLVETRPVDDLAYLTYEVVREPA
jgi:dihydrofolate reductase